MDYNPTEELGLIPEKQFVTSCNGILTANDYARDLCARFIRNGERFFDIVSRYEDLTTYTLNRDEGKAASTMKMIAPFLKACGVTDHLAYDFAKNDLKVIDGAAETMNYLRGLLPSYVVTGSYEHHIMALCDSIGFPQDSITYTSVEFDSVDPDRSEARMIREMASKISSLRLPKTLYTISDSLYLDDDDAVLVEELDRIFQTELPKTQLGTAFKDVRPVNANEKAYALLDIRRKTDIEFHSTVYVGSGINDYQALDLVRDSSGLAISYNGGEYAVRGSNIAVMSSNSIVIAVLAAEFYNEGIQAVFDLVENWDREKLETCKCADRNLMDRMLRTFPRKLPVVKMVTRKNTREIIQESEEYRRKMQR